MSATRPYSDSNSLKKKVAKITKKSNQSTKRLATEIASTTCQSNANKSGVFGDHHQYPQHYYDHRDIIITSDGCVRLLLSLYYLNRLFNRIIHHLGFWGFGVLGFWSKR